MKTETVRRQKRFTELRCRTLDSWSCERRIISKIKLLPGKKNLRFIVTNLPGEGGENDGNKTHFRSQEFYEDFHCAQGAIENPLKEQQMNLFSERFPL